MEINVILSASFEKWLRTLDYAPSTVYASVRYVNDFFFYLKAFEISSLEAVQPETVTGTTSTCKPEPTSGKTAAYRTTT